MFRRQNAIELDLSGPDQQNRQDEVRKPGTALLPGASRGQKEERAAHEQANQEQVEESIPEELDAQNETNTLAQSKIASVVSTPVNFQSPDHSDK